MTREDMIAAVEGEILRLEQVRDLLRASTSDRFGASDSGSSTNGRRSRTLSEDARSRIAQAQKRRWAKQRSLNGAGSGELSSSASQLEISTMNDTAQGF